MKFILRQFKQILLTILLVHVAAIALPQTKNHKHSIREQLLPTDTASNQLKDFKDLVSDASMYFKFPPGFKEIPVPDDEDYPFEYAMEIPGKEFEIWFHVVPQKNDYAAYERVRNDKSKRLESPDSLYINIGQAQASALSEDQHFFMRNISSDVLVKFSANAGKSYLLNLADVPETKHYKYALLLTMEKDHVGTILMVCFTNEKTPEFFKNVNRISYYCKFKRILNDPNSQ